MMFIGGINPQLWTREEEVVPRDRNASRYFCDSKLKALELPADQEKAAFYDRDVSSGGIISLSFGRAKNL
jgi:hypothetical protein